MRPDVVLGIHSKGIDCADSRRGAPNPVAAPCDSTSSTSTPAEPDRMYAIATRPVAGSIPIAGRTAFRPRVTTDGAVQVTPSSEVETKTALVDAPGAQSCHTAQMRPFRSTSAEGSGNARKPRIVQELRTSAIRTGAPHVAPPSVEREAATADGFVSHR